VVHRCTRNRGMPLHCCLVASSARQQLVFARVQLTSLCVSAVPPCPAPLQRLVPEPRTFNIVMNACNTVGQFADCIKVHERMVEQNVTPTVGTYNAVLLAYCK
jgi:pentatricopeptide repeat protein